MKKVLKKIIIIPLYIFYFLFVELLLGIGFQKDVWQEMVDWTNKD